jgi:hypothetical protein
MSTPVRHCQGASHFRRACQSLRSIILSAQPFEFVTKPDMTDTLLEDRTL